MASHCGSVLYKDNIRSMACSDGYMTASEQRSFVDKLRQKVPNLVADVAFSQVSSEMGVVVPDLGSDLRGNKGVTVDGKAVNKATMEGYLPKCAPGTVCTKSFGEDLGSAKHHSFGYDKNNSHEHSFGQDNMHGQAHVQEHSFGQDNMHGQARVQEQGFGQ